jgi:hypothetical protein
MIGMTSPPLVSFLAYLCQEEENEIYLLGDGLQPELAIASGMIRANSFLPGYSTESETILSGMPIQLLRWTNTCGIIY